MSKITIDEVKKLAMLSKLDLSDDDAIKLTKDVENLLQYVDRLSEVDTEGVKPTAQVTGLTNVARNDEIIDYDVSREELLKNAPEQKDGYIKVKKVL